MAQTAHEVFLETVQQLPQNEQLRLAAMILQELKQVEQSDKWSEQDQKDLTTVSLQYAAELYPEEEDIV